MAIGPEEEYDRDHLPAKSFFPKRLRKEFSPLLTTLWVHRHCNSGVALDEQYFVSSIGPMAGTNPIGAALMEDLRASYTGDDRKSRLGRMALEEFGDLALPGGLRYKRYDHARISLVLWKIARGLVFVETGVAIPPRTPYEANIYPTPEETARTLPDWFPLVRNTHPMGQHGAVFEYKALGLRFWDSGESGQVWAFLFWNQVMATVMFHNQSCCCESCRARTAIR